MERTSITNTAASTTNAGSITTHHFHAIIASIRSVSVTTCETVHPPRLTNQKNTTITAKMNPKMKERSDTRDERITVMKRYR